MIDEVPTDEVEETAAPEVVDDDTAAVLDFDEAGVVADETDFDVVTLLLT